MKYRLYRLSGLWWCRIETEALNITGVGQTQLQAWLAAKAYLAEVMMLAKCLAMGAR
jgi:hypothetical protein